eukprot:NODE_5213_length_593_cov_84.198529_g4510_i0.p1 GENE.NODE_5213_length_593_cov_84.198529_g4510_i0~~NODE_5213_length_593_cov_84.198529_g4510_i0.p1  ORF type:complete len:165 (-),score=91.83 NODE_5213_length_593_cov_84.198529_g4510_i0:98-526(-)
MRNGHGYMMLYSVTQTRSFEEVEELHAELLEAKEGAEVPLVLVANKVDLDKERVVTTEEGEQMAQRLNCKYIETSAKTRQNVDDAFVELIRLVLKRHHPEIYQQSEEEAPDAEEDPEPVAGESNPSKKKKEKKKKKKKCVIL